MENVKGRDLRFAAVVTSVEHKESKNGKKYGVVHLEDYIDGFRLFLFGTDYTDYKNFLTEGWVLFIKGKVQSRQWGDSDQLEFKIHKIQMLDQLVNLENRTLLIEVPFDEVNDEMISGICTLIDKNKGDHSMKIKLINYTDKYIVDLLSRKNRVDLNNNLIEDLNKINGLKVVIES
jgi:DNA polymerase-3 subunit alpha